MRLAILLMGIFLLSLTVRSAQGRELLVTEKAVLINLDRVKNVQQYMQTNIDESALSFRDFLSYQIQKKACLPMEQIIKKIEGEAADYPDQSLKLLQAYVLCSQGVLGQSHLYVEQNK